MTILEEYTKENHPTCLDCKYGGKPRVSPDPYKCYGRGDVIFCAKRGANLVFTGVCNHFYCIDPEKMQLDEIVGMKGKRDDI